ncbi:hypothetical protein AWC38_SpisGene9988 [Stylophora pistillata]|uniref:Uncharacterized protein n=1 Tax=Stylophora pistillata TaxID=50429 RepID=A0A2B4S8R4_STYPI|nr:hypothetical protein AWC38_SpisGene9988 [Stylophora pistillata]
MLIKVRLKRSVPIRGRNWAIFGCGSCRRTKGISIVKLPSAVDKRHRKWREEWLGEIKKTREMEADFRGSDKKNVRVCTCEKHFATEDVEIFHTDKLTRRKPKFANVIFTGDFVNGCPDKICFICEGIGNEASECQCPVLCCICKEEGHLGINCDYSWVFPLTSCAETDETDEVNIDVSDDHGSIDEDAQLASVLLPPKRSSENFPPPNPPFNEELAENLPPVFPSPCLTTSIKLINLLNRNNLFNLNISTRLSHPLNLNSLSNILNPYNLHNTLNLNSDTLNPNRPRTISLNNLLNRHPSLLIPRFWILMVSLLPNPSSRHPVAHLLACLICPLPAFTLITTNNAESQENPVIDEFTSTNASSPGAGALADQCWGDTPVEAPEALKWLENSGTSENVNNESSEEKSDEQKQKEKEEWAKRMKERIEEKRKQEELKRKQEELIRKQKEELKRKEEEQKRKQDKERKWQQRDDRRERTRNSENEGRREERREDRRDDRRERSDKYYRDRYRYERDRFNRRDFFGTETEDDEGWQKAYHERRRKRTFLAESTQRNSKNSGAANVYGPSKHYLNKAAVQRKNKIAHCIKVGSGPVRKDENVKDGTKKQWKMWKLEFTHQHIEKGSNKRMAQLIKNINESYKLEKREQAKPLTVFAFWIGAVDTTAYHSTEKKLRLNVVKLVKCETAPANETAPALKCEITPANPVVMTEYHRDW